MTLKARCENGFTLKRCFFNVIIESTVPYKRISDFFFFSGFIHKFFPFGTEGTTCWSFSAQLPHLVIRFRRQ